MKYSIKKSHHSSVMFTHENGVKAYRATPVELEFWARIEKLETALLEIAYMTRLPSKRPSGGAQISLSANDMAEIANEALNDNQS